MQKNVPGIKWLIVLLEKEVKKYFRSEKIVFEGGRSIMNIGNQILNIRKENQLTQEEFGKLFHVTRQTVSNWENGKSYPDLQVLVDISNQL